MKKQLKKTIMLSLFSLCIIAAHSQKKSNEAAPWVSDKGYWVVESNIHDPLYHTIRFYNNENVLLHTANLSGEKLNADKKKVKMRLKEALEAAVVLYAKQQEPEAINDYIVGILKKAYGSSN